MRGVFTYTLWMIYITHNLLEVERTSHFNHNLHPFRLCETKQHVEIQDLDLDALAMEKGSPLAAP